MCIFKRKLKQSDLIDLVAYEAECTRAVEQGGTIRPLSMWHECPAGLSNKDKQRFDDNLLIATRIYKRYRDIQNEIKHTV